MVEKKSTKGKVSKPTATKPATRARKSKPESEVQSAVVEQVKTLNLNWDVIGFSSAAVTLLGAAIFYLIGWSYEVNWQAYFGISMNDVSIPPQQVIIQSIPTVVSIVFEFVFSLVLYIILILIRRGKKKTENINFDIEVYLVISAIFSTIQLVSSVFINSNKGIVFVSLTDFTNPSKNPSEYQYLFTFLISFILLYLYSFVERNTKLVNKSSLVITRSIRISFLLLFVAALGLTNAASQGIYDAARGVRLSGGWTVQMVYVTNINGKSIDGPLGLVGENDSSFFLIRWKKDNQQYFQRNPGLYIFPRDGLAIIPANDPSLTIAVLSETPTVMPQPTQTTTITPKPTNTLAPTITPTIGQP